MSFNLQNSAAKIASRYLRATIHRLQKSNQKGASGEHKLGPASGMVRGLRYGEEDEEEDTTAEFDPNLIGLPTIPQAYEHFTQRELSELAHRQQNDDFEKDYFYRDI